MVVCLVGDVYFINALVGGVLIPQNTLKYLIFKNVLNYAAKR